MTSTSALRILSGGCGLALTAAVGAGELSYRVTDLGTIDPGASGVSRAFGVNVVGEIVGASTVAGGETHAFIWLPSPAYGLAAGLHDLNVIARIEGPSVARAINDHGAIAGQARPNPPTAARAFAWDLAQGISHDLGSLSIDPDAQSIAYAINELDPPRVIGEANFDGPDGFGVVGFRVLLGGPMVALQPAGATCSVARDNNNHVPPDGGDRSTGASYNGLCEIDVDPCAGRRWGTVWGFPGLLRLREFVNGPGSEGWGINDADEVVGRAWRMSAPECEWRATYWPHPQGDPVALGPVGTLAQKISNRDAADEARIVGTNLETGEALLWTSDGAGWSAHTLNDLIAPACPWTLRAAHDVGVEGWIVGEGEVELDSGAVTHAFLLTPLPNCPADVDRDTTVDFADLLAILAAWGGCPPGVICTSDVNADCTVDPVDLLALLGAWGSCP